MNNLQSLIREAIELKETGVNIKTDLGCCQVELNKSMIAEEKANFKVVDKAEKVDCEYCGRKYADTLCMNHPNPCHKV